MKLSIITINYNNAEGLRRTMESVLNQSCRDFEYIVIDGGSSDASKDIILSHRDRLSHWVSEPDEGIYNAMNKGILAATGEYCLFLNSGDYLYADSVIENILNMSYNEDIVSFVTINTDGKVSHRKKAPENLSLYSLIDASLPHPSTLIKRSILEKMGGYDESYKIVSDWIFFIEALVFTNSSYRTIDYNLSVFDRTSFSVSTHQSDLRDFETKRYLNSRLPRVLPDYFLPEHMYNALWFLKHTRCSFFFSLLSVSLRVINRLFRLRNRLSKKNSVFKID